ncbi:hypothetical protein [Rhodovulum euryhalinum]|uniref:Uncharacterized protein n=1 Tax=Rhodovulum euryhalinum TaxID=35805 RepID=A0A4R2KL04_9RHOB|nr:hypothetical protein [Rhodovulum euryhalinum]TCO74044.1 hypothetical protein EV655_101201 [Rhodovulum euryhalinum]
MSALSRTRGAAPVALLDELPPVERAAVRCLRGWTGGTAARVRMRRNFARVFGAAADVQQEALDVLMDLVLGAARRPLARNAPDHPEVGGDENAFAQMVAAAVGGERDEALVFALALMGPEAAFEAVIVAERLGLALLGLLRARPGAPLARHLN